MDPRIALEIASFAAEPEQPECLPSAQPEAHVRGQGDRYVEVEDALGDPLVGVSWRDHECQHDSDAEQAGRAIREEWKVIP